MMHGMAYLPENRKEEGIIADLSVRENLIIALQAKRGMFHLMSKKDQEDFTDESVSYTHLDVYKRQSKESG